MYAYEAKQKPPELCLDNTHSGGRNLLFQVNHHTSERVSSLLTLEHSKPFLTLAFRRWFPCITSCTEARSTPTCSRSIRVIDGEATIHSGFFEVNF